MTMVRERHLPVREKRDGSIAAYAGTIGALQTEARDGGFIPRVRTFAQDTQSDLQAALELLSTIDKLAIVVHGPAGCFSGLSVAERSLVTGITERDSILGGDKKLRATIRKAALEFRPEAIAVVGSPVAAINNDDADAVIAETRNELELPVFLVRADAFKSKLSANGTDLVSHAILRTISDIGGPPEGEPAVVLLSLRQAGRDIDTLVELLSDIDVRVSTFPRYSKPREWKNVARARAAIAVDPSDADFVGHAMQEEFSVRYLAGAPPIGVENTTDWLLRIADALGKQSAAAQVAVKQASVLDDSKRALERHQGAKVYLSASPGVALALVSLVEELGLGLAGLTLTHVDSRHTARISELADSYPQLPILVGEGQAFEEANVLRKIGASLYVGQQGSLAHVLRLGIPVLDLTGTALFGYSGAVRFAEAVCRRLANTALAQFLAQGEQSYSAQWFAKSTHWFIKHEVK